MEKGPKVRIIGGATREIMDKVRGNIERAFEYHIESLDPSEQEKLRKFELLKSPEEVAIINFANEETSRLMEDAGLKSYDVPLVNLHIVPTDLYNDITHHEGFATTYKVEQGIFLNELAKENLINFGLTVFHELMHLKSHLTLEVQEKGGKIHKTQNRGGAVVRAAQKMAASRGYHNHFTGLDEGIVAEAEKRFFAKLIELPELTQQRMWLATEENQKLKKKISIEKVVPEDDVYWAGTKSTEDWHFFTYLAQRKVIMYVCEEIHKQFPNQYKNTDEVYKTFLNAIFTGRLLGIARLVEETFGDGSFRLLGNMGTEQQSGVLYLQTMKKARLRKINS
jgi:hypothetical protein